MKKMKRILSIFLILCSLPAASPMALAEKENESIVLPYFAEFKEGTIPGEISQYIFDGCDYSFEPYPSAENPSFCFKPKAGGYQGYLDIEINPAEKVVIESSLMFTGKQASVQRIFTITGTGGINVLGTRNKNGTFKLTDNSNLEGIVKDKFIDLVYIVDCSKKSYDVMLNGKTVRENCPFADKNQQDVKKVRIHVSSINATGDIDEKIYLNYLKVYNADRYLNEEEYKVATASIRTFEQPIDTESVEVTPQMVDEAMQGNILLYLNIPRARVGNDVKYIDENKELYPFLMDNTTMVPLRFLAENLGATVNYNSSQVKINLNEKEVLFNQGKKEFFVNGEKRELPVAPYTRDERIFVPLRAISEGLGKKVFYDVCGYVAVGDTVDEFDMTTRLGRNLLFEAAYDVILDLPSPEQVAEDVKNYSQNSHPRIMLTAKRLEELREEIKTDPQQKYWYEQQLKKSENYLKTPLLIYGREDATRMLGKCREMLRMLPTLSLSYLLSGNEAYKKRAVDELINICTFPDWNPHHFLDVAEMSMAVSMAYDWLYHELSEEERVTIETAIKKYALDEIIRDFNDEPIGKNRDRSATWWKNVSNWLVVCSGGVSSAALAVMDKYPDLAGEIVSRSFRFIANLVKHNGPDGGTDESPGYWRYMMEFFAYYASSLTTSTGSDYRLLDLPGMKEFPYFYEDLTAPAGILSFGPGDVTAGLDSRALLHFAQRFNNPELVNMYLDDIKGTSWQTGFAECMIWYNPDFYNADFKALMRERYLRSTEVVTMRAGSDTENELMVGFKGGGGSHNDAGSVIIDLFGLRWVRDPGRDHAYYNTGTDRKSYYRNRTEGHSTLTINPNLGYSANPYVENNMERVEGDEHRRFAILDMSNAYEFLGTTSVRRGVMLERERQYVIIRDEVKAKENMDFYWFLQVPEDIKVLDDKKTAILSQEGKKFAVQILNDGDYEFYTTEAKPLPISPYRSDAADESGWARLAVHTTDLKELEISVGITPIYGEEEIPAYKPDVPSLDEWKLTGDELRKPTLNSISIDGVEIEEYENDTIAYAREIKQGSQPPVISAECDSDCDIQIVQPIKGNLSSKITVYKKDNRELCKSYYVYFDEVPVDVGEPTFPAEKLIPKSIYAEHVPQIENPPENASDGDYTTRWSSNKIGTEIDFDLGSKKQVDYIGIALMGGAGRRTRMKIFVSDDKEEWTQIFSGMTAGNTEELVLFDTGNIKTRYIRIAGFGNSDESKWFSPTEINFWKRLDEEQ